MNSRRDFFKTLGVASAALFLPKLPGAFKWRQHGPNDLWIPNPEYRDAPYEISFLYPPGQYGVKSAVPVLVPVGADARSLVVRYKQYNRAHELYPLRLAADGKTYVWPFTPLKKSVTRRPLSCYDVEYSNRYNETYGEQK